MAHLAGAIYMQIMDVQVSFSTIVTLSGTGNTSRTGKSLMTSMWQLAFLGHKPMQRILKLTEANVFDLLDEGTPIYRKYKFFQTELDQQTKPENKYFLRGQCIIKKNKAIGLVF